jgi:hypothetical protein
MLRRGTLAALALCMTFAHLTGCNSSQSASPAKPSTAEVIGHESELLRLTLSAPAVARLGIETTSVGNGRLDRSITLHGEVVVPPSEGGLPFSSATDLTALAASQARTDADLARARAELDIATRNAERAEALVREEAGSARARDEALTTLAVARSNAEAARLQRAQFGPAMDALGSLRSVWIRIAVPVSDLPHVDRKREVLVTHLGDARQSSSARPVSGPPSANPAAATVDLYYALDNPAGPFRIGQRVAVAVPASTSSNSMWVPASAVLRDIYGGEWVYVATADHTYERRRIEIAAIQNGVAHLSRGLVPGAKVVTAGAAELFGTEFGAK